MILPSKHIRLSESILGFSGYLFSQISSTACTVDEIWDLCQNSRHGQVGFAHQSYDNMIKALDLLFMMGLIDINEEGKIEKV